MITGKNIVFIFANKEAASLLHIGSETRHSRYTPTKSSHSIGENNSALIEHFMKVANITLEQLPCLVFENLISDNREPIFIPLSNDSDIVSIMTYISIRTEDCLNKINCIRDQIVRCRFRKIEYYYDMKRRFIRICKESQLIDENELYDNFAEFETNDNPYAEKRLKDMWVLVYKNTDKKIYGDRNGSLIDKICSIKKEIENFAIKYEQFENKISDLDNLQNELSDVIKKIDTCSCSEDAYSYAKTQIEELESVFRKHCLDGAVRNEVIQDLNKCIFNKKENCNINYNTKQEILDKIRNCEATRIVDDLSRISFILDILFRILTLF